MPDYFIDRFRGDESPVQTVRRPRRLQPRELWKEPFTDGGRTLAFEEAVRAFSRSHGTSWTVDLDVRRLSRRSGRIPRDRRELVRSRGIRRVRGQVAAHRVSLEPCGRDVGERAHHSGEQFRRAGPARVGSHRDLDAYGAQDMAGNAKEWCWNPSGGKRYILGAAWNEPPHMFNELDAQSPFDRGVRNGFRLVKYSKMDLRQASPSRSACGCGKRPSRAGTSASSEYLTSRKPFLTRGRTATARRAR